MLNSILLQGLRKGVQKEPWDHRSMMHMSTRCASLPLFPPSSTGETPSTKTGEEVKLNARGVVGVSTIGIAVG